MTPAFDLPLARWVIHAVGPRYSGPQDAQVLALAYSASLTRADEVGARTVAFPAISTGVYGYPDEDAAAISVRAVCSARTRVQSVLLVAFGRRTAQLWQDALDVTTPA